MNECEAAQVAFWGHPVTTGSAAIDYFVGSQLFLPADKRAPLSNTVGGVPLCSRDAGRYGFVERSHVCMRSMRCACPFPVVL